MQVWWYATASYHILYIYLFIIIIWVRVCIVYIRELRRVNPKKIICPPRVSTYLRVPIYVCVLVYNTYILYLYIYTTPLEEEKKRLGSRRRRRRRFFSYLLFFFSTYTRARSHKHTYIYVII